MSTQPKVPSRGCIRNIAKAIMSTQGLISKTLVWSDGDPQGYVTLLQDTALELLRDEMPHGTFEQRGHTFVYFHNTSVTVVDFSTDGGSFSNSVYVSCDPYEIPLLSEVREVFDMNTYHTVKARILNPLTEPYVCTVSNAFVELFTSTKSETLLEWWRLITGDVSDRRISTFHNKKKLIVVFETPGSGYTLKRHHDVVDDITSSTASLKTIATAVTRMVSDPKKVRSDATSFSLQVCSGPTSLVDVEYDVISDKYSVFRELSCQLKGAYSQRVITSDEGYVYFRESDDTIVSWSFDVIRGDSLMMNGTCAYVPGLWDHVELMKFVCEVYDTDGSNEEINTYEGLKRETFESMACLALETEKKIMQLAIAEFGTVHNVSITSVDVTYGTFQVRGSKGDCIVMVDINDGTADIKPVISQQPPQPPVVGGSSSSTESSTPTDILNKFVCLTLNKIYLMMREGHPFTESLPEYVTSYVLVYLISFSPIAFRKIWRQTTGDNSPKDVFILSTPDGGKDKFNLCSKLNGKMMNVNVSLKDKTMRVVFEYPVTPTVREVLPESTEPDVTKPQEDLSTADSTEWYVQVLEMAWLHADTDLVVEDIKKLLFKRTVEVHLGRHTTDAPLLKTLTEILFVGGSPLDTKRAIVRCLLEVMLTWL